MSTVDVLDLTHTPESQRLETLLIALDGLASGGILEVHTAPNWDGLVPRLQEQRWGHFDWRPLEEGPERWVADLVRLESVLHSSDSVRDFLSRDHQRCDTLYAAAENAANEEDTAAMVHFCQRFLVSMMHHFRMEEELFFPAFEEKTGMRQGPTTVMRSEHVQMRNLMDQMRQASEKQDADLLLKAGGTLMFVMQQHNVKEEQMLYPMADAHLGSDVASLLKKMQQI